ncbi:phospholipase D family protein [Mycolicibacterium sp. 141076]|uniref:phospholipase D family protein n=1 Tax=Mycolicibacterium sp. 141076 TaxID=3090599 RepID=UPI00299D05D8|nr:phospholipase D family protein [Mycolicibacterium sp. 141076]MDX1878950.1 phospholipase D family protein [Mycolicibacterium sp. 141076]
MFEPDGRAALTEQLRPPSGFQLEHCVATTFTLDLTAALSIPLAFAAHRVRESRDPIAILDSIRRAADKLDVFAQAGQVSEPRVGSDLFALLEPVIHPVSAPRQGMLFHPKVWVLAYSSGDARSYRVLCASRNLTNDRSWDLVVRLDGLATDGPVEQSAPLAAFVRALPRMAVQPLSAERIGKIGAIADAISTVEWELPTDVRWLRFHPLGVPGIPSIPLGELFSGIRHGIISPFLSDEGIQRVVPMTQDPVVVLSRREQLDRLLPQTLGHIDALVLDDAANDDVTSDDGDGDQVASGLGSGAPEFLTGLHAKAYVLDRQSGSHLLVGSPNATHSAFGGNVELLVEFEGPRPKLGVAALVGEGAGLRALTLPYQPAGGDEIPPDELADHDLEQALRTLALRRYFARVEMDQPSAVDGDAPQYRIRLTAEGTFAVPDGAQARVSLLTRPANAAEIPGMPAIFQRLALTDITPFLVLRVTDARGVTASTVVASFLEGDIPGRQDAVVARQLTDRSAFMRLLALLLAIEGGEGALQFGALGSMTEGWAEDGSGLFETLVRAIGAEHDGLSDVQKIVEHVRAAEQRRPLGTPSVLPDGFDELWEAVWIATGRAEVEKDAV